MPKPKSEYLIDPDAPLIEVEQKLEQVFGRAAPEPLIPGKITIEMDSEWPDVGRPFADWRTPTYEDYRSLRAQGMTEKSAAGEIAKKLGKSDAAIVKAMRWKEDAITIEFWWAIRRKDPTDAAQRFAEMDRYLRERISKRLSLIAK